MKLLTAEVKKLTLILGVLGMVVGALPMANAGEAAGYIGKKIFVDKKNAPKDISGQPKYLIGEIVHKQGHDIFLLAEGHRTNRIADWMLVHDAIDIPKGQQLIGAPIEDECIAENEPNDTVLVIGKWINHKSRNGGYAGGHAYPITKAWRVDFDAIKLKEISTKGIKCEDNRTEGDFN
jgi:hypothetical protein